MAQKLHTYPNESDIMAHNKKTPNQHTVHKQRIRKIIIPLLTELYTLSDIGPIIERLQIHYWNGDWEKLGQVRITIDTNLPKAFTNKLRSEKQRALSRIREYKPSADRIPPFLIISQQNRYDHEYFFVGNEDYPSDDIRDYQLNHFINRLQKTLDKQIELIATLDNNEDKQYIRTSTLIRSLKKRLKKAQQILETKTDNQNRGEATKVIPSTRKLWQSGGIGELWLVETSIPNKATIKSQIWRVLNLEADGTIRFEILETGELIHVKHLNDPDIPT